MGRFFRRLPNTISRNDMVAMLTRLGGRRIPGGRHAEKWQFDVGGRVLTIPLSVYDEYHKDFYMRVFRHELGLSYQEVVSLLDKKATVRVRPVYRPPFGPPLST